MSGTTLLSPIPINFTGTLSWAFEYNPNPVILGQFLSSSSSSDIYTSGSGSTKIDWGDGSAIQTLNSNNYLIPTTSSDGNYVYSIVPSQQNNHNYANVGNFNVTITITDGITTLIIASQVVIQEAPLFAGEINGTLSANNQFSLTATFTQTTIFSINQLSNFYSVIDWGDGSPTTLGQMTGVGFGSSKWIYTTTALHNYPLKAVNANYTIVVVSINGDNILITTQDTITIPAITTLPNNAIFLIQTYPMVGIKNKKFKLIATITDLTGINLHPCAYNVRIKWSDHDYGEGTVNQIRNCGGQYTIEAKHKFKHKGIYNVIVYVNDVPAVAMVTIT